MIELTRIFKSPRALAIVGLRMVLGVVFFYSGWVKIIDPAAFAQNIANYQLLPPVWGNVMALFLPGLELVCGVCLITGWMARTSAIIVSALLTIFMVALGMSLYRGLDIHCGCFTNGEAPASNLYVDLIRDAILLAMAAFVALRRLPTDRNTPVAG